MLEPLHWISLNSRQVRITAQPDTSFLGGGLRQQATEVERDAEQIIVALVAHRGTMLSPDIR